MFVCVCVYTNAWRISVVMYLCVKSVMSWNKGPSQREVIRAAGSLELHPQMLRWFHHTRQNHVASAASAWKYGSFTGSDCDYSQ